jgi:formylglycine-generating enzyme
MRRRPVVLSVMAGALAACVAAACSDFTSDDPPAIDGGGADAALEAQAAPLPEAAADAGDPADAAPDGACGAGQDGRPMARVGTTCVDVYEVTVAAYTTFVATSPAVPDAGPQCGANDIHVDPGCVGTPPTDAPQTCVDWCDAYSYCAWAGKRLCGDLGGGALAVGDQDRATHDAWYRACAGLDDRTYAYGSTYDGGACQTRAAPLVPVGAKKACVTPEGVHDLNGNATEWIDSCTAPSTSADCYAHGGDSLSDDRGKCAGAERIGRFDRRTTLGFRCCSD